MSRLTAAVVTAALSGWTGAAQTQRTITFSNYNWTVKTSASRVGPGPNFFSNSTDNVWVDTAGRLHLKVVKRGGRWYCAEVVSQDSFGYGTYRFLLDSPVDALDPQVVLGLFTWNDDPEFNHRELDVEFSRWGAPNNLNAQYVVQPYDVPQNIYRFSQPPGVPQSTHSFLWTAASAYFLSLRGLATLKDSQNFIDERTFNSGIPQAGGENARMNLWLFRGRAPKNRQPVEVIVNRFEHVP